MSENFNAIKKKYFVTAVIVSAVLGVFCGIAAACTLAVVFKSCAVSFFWALYIPIGIVFAALAGGLFFLVLRPSDKKVAKKLDRDFSLNQKAQTMVEFASAEGAMVELQREQADRALGEVAKKPVDLKWLYKFAIVPVIAVAMLFTGIFIPARKASDPYKEPPKVDMTEAQRTAVRALIADVERSELESGLKTEVKEVLNGILVGLDTPMQESVRKAAVIASVKVIDALIASANSYVSVCTALKANEALTDLADIILQCASFYKGGGILISTLDSVTAKYKDADVLISGAISGWTEAFLDTLSDGDEEDPQPLTVPEQAAKVKTLTDALKRALSGVMLPGSDDDAVADALYKALQDFTTNLAGVRTVETSPTTYNASVKGYCNDFTAAGTVGIMVQAYNCMMDEFVRNSLARIFNISQSELGSNETVVPDDPNKEPEIPKEPGATGGGIQHPGEDVVLDIDSGKLVPYYELLDAYYNRVTELINSGACSEEVALYIREYYQRLYSGLDDKE